MLKRVDAQNWECRGGRDYLLVGEDLFSKHDYRLMSDTLIIQSGRYPGKKFIVTYCIFDNLWLKSIDSNEIAWFTDTMSSDDW